MSSYSKTPKLPPEPLPEKDGHRWLREHKIPYEIRPDGVTVVKGDVHVPETRKQLVGRWVKIYPNQHPVSQLPFIDIVPWEVTGSFDCNGNHLTSLQGAPRVVGGYFDCGGNQLTNLHGAPQVVGGDFSCHNNALSSLSGAPQSVSGEFRCGGNQLTSLQGAPQFVGGDFSCGRNQLTSLQGAPQSVGGNFDCSSNQLTSLQGAPQTVGGGFVCGSNQLVDFSGLEQTTLKGKVAAWGNPLVSLDGLPAGVALEGVPDTVKAMHKAVQDLGPDL